MIIPAHALTQHAPSPTVESRSPESECLSRPEAQARTEQLLATEIDFISNRCFSDKDAEAMIDVAEPTAEEPSEKPSSRLPKDLPAHLARLCEPALLTATEERALFKRMNYFKFRANALRSTLDPQHPNVEALQRVDGYLKKAKDERDRIVQANMRLVISIVKKFVTPQQSFDEMLSDGIMSLMQAVDKFDFDRGFRFSTYAYRAIARNAYRSIMERQKENARFSVNADNAGCDIADEGGVSAVDEQRWNELQGCMTRLMDRLDRREKFIVRGRFALGSHRKVRTFQSLADKLGVSKERVRQLEQRAIAKLRGMAADMRMDELVDPMLS